MFSFLTCTIALPYDKHQLLQCSCLSQTCGTSTHSYDAPAMCDVGEQNALAVKVPQNTRKHQSHSDKKTHTTLHVTSGTMRTNGHVTLANVKCNIPALFLS